MSFDSDDDLGDDDDDDDTVSDWTHGSDYSIESFLFDVESTRYDHDDDDYIISSGYSRTSMFGDEHVCGVLQVFRLQHVSARMTGRW